MQRYKDLATTEMRAIREDARIFISKLILIVSTNDNGCHNAINMVKANAPIVIIITLEL